MTKNQTSVILKPIKSGSRMILCTFYDVSRMINVLIDHFEVHTTIKEVWVTLRADFVGSSATRLR